MALRQDQFQLARRISRTIQEYLEAISQDGLRSTDVYPVLARKGIIEKDRHNGLKFRQFLKMLYDNNALTQLIPQCKSVPPTKHQKYMEWYFYKQPTSKLNIDRDPGEDKAVIIVNTPRMSDDEIDADIEIKSELINQLPKRSSSYFKLNELETRRNYPRAYEIWTEKEIDIMVTAWRSYRKVNKVALLLKRQPSSVEGKLKGVGEIE